MHRHNFTPKAPAETLRANAEWPLGSGFDEQAQPNESPVGPSRDHQGGAVGRSQQPKRPCAGDTGHPRAPTGRHLIR
eukprot:scaffold454049_cov35-Prasinocladus_malaysianus.AAC.1